jgi:hypothetical protein
MAERCIPGSLRFFTGSSTPDRGVDRNERCQLEREDKQPLPQNQSRMSSDKREQQMLRDGSATKVEETEEDKRGERPHSRYHPYM